MSLTKQNYVELAFAVVLSTSVLVGTLFILASLGGCGGTVESADPGITNPNIPSEGSGGPVSDCIRIFGGRDLCNPGVVDDLRERVRELEEQLGLAEDLVGQCELGLEQCVEELGSTGAALEECLTKLEEPICCGFDELPGQRRGWYKHCGN